MESSNLNYPSRSEVQKVLEDLYEGDISREDAANWAGKFVNNDDPTYDYDDAIWDALELLSGADFKTSARTYFHDRVDFCAWLEDFKNTEVQK